MPDIPAFNIAAVERDTGLSKDVLRMWERRYGFPTPDRDANGERSYPAEQVEHLRLIKRLLDQGHRPGKLLAASPEALAALAPRHKREDTVPPPDAEALDALLGRNSAGRKAQFEAMEATMKALGEGAADCWRLPHELRNSKGYVCHSSFRHASERGHL